MALMDGGRSHFDRTKVIRGRMKRILNVPRTTRKLLLIKQKSEVTGAARCSGPEKMRAP